jgi:hypothetical protein
VLSDVLWVLVDGAHRRLDSAAYRDICQGRLRI